MGDQLRTVQETEIPEYQSMVCAQTRIKPWKGNV